MSKLPGSGQLPHRPFFLCLSRSEGQQCGDSRTAMPFPRPAARCIRAVHSGLQASRKGLRERPVALWQGRVPPCPALAGARLSPCQPGCRELKRGKAGTEPSCGGSPFSPFLPLPAGREGCGKEQATSRSPCPRQRL